jgi:hypothetical protein
MEIAGPFLEHPPMRVIALNSVKLGIKAILNRSNAGAPRAFDAFAPCAFP